MTDMPVEAGRRKPAWGVLFAIFLVNCFCHLFILGDAPLSGTEGNRALPADYMVRSGHWAVPMLYGRPYLRKPPLHHWMIAGLEKVTGRANEFIWRLPSVLDMGILAVILTFFTWRWFGRRAGIVAGLAPLALVCIWGDARCADIDMTNITVSVAAALCLIELYFRNPPRPWVWTIAAGVLIGASLLTKGPAGAPDFGGVWVWAAIAAVRGGRWKWLASPRTWVPWLIGAAMFGAWALYAWMWIRGQGFPPDMGGVHEGTLSLMPTTLGRVGGALLLAPTLILLAMPLSLAFFSVFVPEVRQNPQDPLHERTMIALAGSIIACWALCLLSGMNNPRYGYVMVPLFAPMAGAMAAAYPRLTDEQKRWFAAWPIGTAIAVAGAHLGFGVRAWHSGQLHWAIITAGVVSALMALAVIIYVGRFRRWRWSWVIVGQCILLSVPFGVQLNEEHWRKSGYSVAQEIRAIVPSADRVYAGHAVFDQPEIYYYSGVNGYTTSEMLPTPDQVEGGQWVLLKNTEFAEWNVGNNPRLTRTKFLRRQDKREDEYLLAWLLPKGAEKSQP